MNELVITFLHCVLDNGTAARARSRGNCDFLRSHVTGGNDAILNEVGRTTAVSLVGTHHGPGMRWDTALGQIVVALPANASLGV